MNCNAHKRLLCSTASASNGTALTVCQVSDAVRGHGDGGRRVASLLQLQDDGPHPAHVLRVLGRLGVEVAQLGDPLPLSAGGDRVLNPGQRDLPLRRLRGRPVSRLELGHLAGKKPNYKMPTSIKLALFAQTNWKCSHCNLCKNNGKAT